MATRPPAVQAIRQEAQEMLERGELVIHRDAQRLKNAAHGQLAFLFSHARQRGANRGGERERGGERLARERSGDRLRMRLVGVVDQQRREFVRARFLRTARKRVARARGFIRMSSGPSCLQRKAARRIVQLHRGNAEIREDDIGAVEIRRHASTCGRPAKLLRCAVKRLGAEAERAQTRFGFRQLDGIRIEAEQTTAGLEAAAGFPARDRRSRACNRPRFRRACGASTSRISATMIGRCEPAGVLPAASTFATVSA